MILHDNVVSRYLACVADVKRGEGRGDKREREKGEEAASLLLSLQSPSLFLSFPTRFDTCPAGYAL